jgi:hypothetical protein
MQWDFWLSVFTLLLAVATLWLVFETRRMRKGGDAAMANMLQHASDSAKAAGISADAAVKSAESTKILAETGQRAWITLEVAEVKPEKFGYGIRLLVVSTLKNCGRTPAVEVRVEERLELFKPPVKLPELDPDNEILDTVGVDSCLKCKRNSYYRRKTRII